MKNIIKTTILAFLLISLGSCSNEKDPVAIPKGFKLNTPITGAAYVLTPENASNVVITLNWDKSDDGALSVPGYEIEIAKGGTNFATIIKAVKSTDLPPTATYALTHEYLNSLLNKPDFAPCVQTNLDIRIKSTVGFAANKLVQYSNVVTVKVTPYLKELSTLAVTLDGQNPVSAPKIAASGLLQVNTDYEGYMWLEPGNYKFFTSQCGEYSATNPYYGVNGSGLLVLNGTAYTVATAGYYYVKANTATATMSYSVTPITAWGIIGNAKTSGTTNSLPAMTYDSDNKIWQTAPGTTIRLKGGFLFKFRANNTDAINLGEGNAGEGNPNFAGTIMKYNGPSFTVPVIPGVTINSYKVILDLSHPRAYTYTLVKQ
jgi:hypothetical protein